MIIVSVCLFASGSVCLSDRISITNHTSKFHQLSVHVTCSRGSVLLCRRCNTLCISGFVDDVTFSHYGLNGGVPQQHRARANTHAACGYWLHSVLDDGRQSQTSSLASVTRPIS